MSVTLFASGTLVSTGSGTEDFLSSPNVAGKFLLQLDMNDMAAGDVIEVRAYKMVLSGGTSRVCYYAMFSGVQPTDALIAISASLANTLTDANAVRFSVKQTLGTAGISLPWAVLNEDDFTNLDATVSSRATPAQVNTEVLDVLNVDTFAQPGQATPAATTTIRLMLAYLYKAWRNRTTQTATQYSLFNDDAATVDQKATFSDNGTTADRGEQATGP